MNDRTKQHLTDDELLEWLDGSAGPAVRTHLVDCGPCRAEAHALQDGISRYAVATRRQAAAAQSARLAEGFAPARALVWHRLRWVGAGALALLLMAQTAWMMKVRPAPVAPQAVSHPAAATALASAQPVAMSDDELLQAVNNDLSDEVPQALAPVGAITVARNRIASEVERKSANQAVKQGEN